MNRLAVAVASVSLLAACQIGPRAMVSASAHYSEAVRVAHAEQLLVNLVRLRYRDGPVFLTVSSISTQFEVASEADLEGELVSGGSGTAGLGSGIRYAERPTISFSILDGEAFQRRMLQPIPIAAIALLAESGWREDRVLRLTTQELNGLENAPTASGPTPAQVPRYQAFREAARLLRDLKERRLIRFEFETRRDRLSAPLDAAVVDGEDSVAAVQAGVRFEPSGSGRLALVADKRRLVLRISPEAEGLAETTRLRDLLRLEPGLASFELIAKEDREPTPPRLSRRAENLAVIPRSLLGVLYFAANGVRVPDAHAGIVQQTRDAAGGAFDWREVLDGSFVVHASRSRPVGASVAVRHRGYWFYIADADAESKATFLLLGDLFSLQSGDVQETKPVLTLPVGN